MTEPRVVSLIASATEIACALGLAELLHPEVFDFGHRGFGWTEWVGL
jgi:hypothetical protein